MKLVLATHNIGKVKELKELLSELSIELLTLNDFPPFPETIEDQDTFEGNALKKARETFQHTGLLSMADDSGLEVDFLDKQPGVYSARFASEKATAKDNNEKLLALLKDVPSEKRTANFRCCIALVGENIESISEGICYGKILTEYKGTNGFGYDPLFFFEPLEKTFAEMDKEEKNKISHRALALSKIKAELISIR